MTTYPSGVVQNYTVSGTGAPDYRPVPEDRWITFSSKEQADWILEEVKKISNNVKTGEPTTGMYAQYYYIIKPPDICIHMIGGQAQADDGSGMLNFIEYSGSLFDGSEIPRPFIDTYSVGTKPSCLKCHKVSEGIGELYWAA